VSRRSVRRKGWGSDARGLYPADQFAGLDLIDPGGHRLVRLGRYLSESDPAALWWDRATLGANVLMRYEPEPDDESEWRTLIFDCKACRDSGGVQTSTVPLGECRDALAETWDKSRMDDTPRRGKLGTHPEPQVR